MKIKATKNVTYLEAKKLFETQSSELDFSKIVQSLSSKPETKTTGTQFSDSDFTIHPSSKVITSVKPKSTSVPQSQSSSQPQSNSRSRSDSSRSHSQTGSQSTSQSSSQSSSQSNSQSRSQSRS